MKSKTLQITLIYIIISLFMAIICHKLLTKYFSESEYFYLYLVKDIFYILTTGLVFKYILSKNEKKNISIFEKLKKTNEEIKESNEKYDIVAKATSDTIWDWKIQEDSIGWNKGIESVFGYNPAEVGKTSRWWFDKIHPEDSIRMSIKLYSFIEQKQKNGKTSIALDVPMELINMF